MAEKKELTMEIRLLLAFVLMGLVLYITPYFYKQPAPQPAANKSGTAQTQTPAPPQPAANASAAAPAPVPAAAAQIPGQVQADTEETFTIETDLFRVVFSNRGAVALSWVLKNYTDQQK